MWSNYDEEAEQAAQVSEEPENATPQTNYEDVIISDVRDTPNGLNFSIQILNTEGLCRLLAVLHCALC